MSSDPIKTILAILLDEITSEIYFIIKTAKKIKKSDLENKLREKRYNLKEPELRERLNKLMKEDFIRNEFEVIHNQTSEPRKYVKGSQREEVFKINNIDVSLLKSKYEEMKKNLLNNFKEKEKKNIFVIFVKKK